VQLRKYLLPEFGSLQLSEITKGHIKRWPGHFRDDNLRNAFIVLRMILTEAEDDGLITTSPIPKGFEIGTVAGDRPTVSAEQFFDMIDIATPEMRLLLLLLWGASLRVGEALALTRGDLDLKAGAVDVTKQVRWLPGGAAVVDPKNDHKRYNVTLYPEALEALRERFNPDVFDRATPVLLGPNGRRLTRSTV
jgi:integrase